MIASTSKSEIQNCSDKKLTNFNEKTCRDGDKFPVNFSGVPDIGDKIFGCLDFKDLKIVTPSARAGRISFKKKEHCGLNF